MAGGTYPAVYNAANEVGVDAFHDGQIGFLDIVDTVARVVDEHQGSELEAALSVEGVLRADAWARSRARKVLGLPDMDAVTRVAADAGAAADAADAAADAAAAAAAADAGGAS